MEGSGITGEEKIVDHSSVAEIGSADIRVGKYKDDGTRSRRVY